MSKTELPPGPRGRFLTGHLREFADTRLEFMTDCARTHGDISTFRIATIRIFLVNHPDLIERVLVTDARRYIKHFGARMYKPVLGNGLVTSEGDFWLRQRRLAQPAFARARLNTYGGQMVELTVRHLRQWQPGQQRNVMAEMSTLTSAIALKTLFGLEATAEREAYTDALREAFSLLSAPLRRVLRWPRWVPTPHNRRLNQAIRRLDELVLGFIDQGRRRAEPGTDLLSTLLHAQDEDGSRMTNAQLRDEAMTLYLAGHETTALTLGWTWYVLAQHPHIEERLVAEWRQVLDGRPPTIEDLPRLRYTEQVVMEAMRLYPPVYLIGREALEETDLGGYRVKRGTTIFLSQWVTHRDPRYFEDPLTFKPERWEPERARLIPKYAYFPFGGGPRICIGNHFAMMEAVLLLATIGQQYRFQLLPDPPVILWPLVTLVPMYGIPVHLERRAGARPYEEVPASFCHSV